MERGCGLLDGPHWYGSYVCADGQYVSIGALEPQFSTLLFNKLGLGDDPQFKHPFNPRCWDALRVRLERIFAALPRQHWADLMEGSDACFSPVLTPAEARHHPHIAARGIYVERDGVLQARPAPRFSADPHPVVGPVPRRGEHSAAILRDAGLSEVEIARLLPTA